MTNCVIFSRNAGALSPKYAAATLYRLACVLHSQSNPKFLDEVEPLHYVHLERTCSVLPEIPFVKFLLLRQRYQLCIIHIDQHVFHDDRSNYSDSVEIEKGSPLTI